MLESWVWFHGFSVAIMVSSGDWWKEAEPFMFGFGFGTMFFITQLYGLPFWRKISPWWRFVPAVVWIVATVVAVTVTDDISNSRLSTLVMIPSGQWACAFAAWLIIYALQCRIQNPGVELFELTNHNTNSSIAKCNLVL